MAHDDDDDLYDEEFDFVDDDDVDDDASDLEEEESSADDSDLHDEPEPTRERNDRAERNDRPERAERNDRPERPRADREAPRGRGPRERNDDNRGERDRPERADRAERPDRERSEDDRPQDDPADGEGREGGENAEEPLDEYGRPEQIPANYVVHIYETKKFHRTIDRPFTPEDAEAFATEFNRTNKNYGRVAVTSKNDAKPKKTLD